MRSFLEQIEEALSSGDGAAPAPVAVEIAGRGSLPSCFDVTGLAVASIAAAGIELSRFAGPVAGRGGSSDGGGRGGALVVDRRHASAWFGFSLRPLGWTLPSPWDPIAGDYATRDGWIRLHTNAPHHRDAALAVLGVAADRAAVAAAVAGWASESLESAVVEAGGCAAAMRSEAEWAEHPQGRAVAQEPLVLWEWFPCAKPAARPVLLPRPLAGLRILDLTRVLAGPVATRFLAAFGAEVLRIDPPDWDEPAVVPEVTVGKRCAGLDLGRAEDRARFEALLAGADVLVHGYRTGALSGLGYSPARIRALNPRLVDVALDAYGHSGPWRDRRGFDSLVQMSCGIADTGRRFAKREQPTPLPVQALDHATGYLMAAAVLRGLRLRRDEGQASSARLSLARTAWMLAQKRAAARSGDAVEQEPLAPESAADLAPAIEATAWGPAQRIAFPLRMPGVAAEFALPACALRSSPAAWLGGGAGADV